MNGTDFLIDTNILIYIIQGRIRISDFAHIRSNLYISSVTCMETLGYSFGDESEEKAVTAFCKTFERIFLSEEIEEQAIIIRKRHKIKMPDAIIAATATIHDITLVTCNNSDYKNISGLKLFTPAVNSI